MTVLYYCANAVAARFFGRVFFCVYVLCVFVFLCFQATIAKMGVAEYRLDKLDRNTAVLRIEYAKAKGGGGGGGGGRDRGGDRDRDRY